jgi:hypothetical protein
MNQVKGRQGKKIRKEKEADSTKNAIRTHC